MNSGIYKITNIKNNKCYIGSSVNIKVRLHDHRKKLGCGDHENGHLQLSWNKYGEESFKFEVLLYCDKEDLLFYEQQAINAFYSTKNGYNICSIAGNCLGIKRSDETKSKMKGNVNGRSNKGRLVSNDTKMKLSIAHKGIVSGMKNKKHSEHTKEKISIAKKGKPSPFKGVFVDRCSVEGRRRQIEAVRGNTNRLGKFHSFETKSKISNSLKSSRASVIKIYNLEGR